MLGHSRTKLSADSAPAQLSLRDEVQRRLPEMTSSQRKVANTFLSRYPVVGLERVTGFAQAAHVSTATVLRFVNSLGFPVYSEFQTALLGQIEDTLQSPLSKMAREPKAAPGSEESALKAYADSAASLLTETVRLIPTSTYDEVTALLADSKRPLMITGGRFSWTVAHYLGLALEPMRPKVTVVPNSPHSWATSLLDVNKRTVMVLFDIRRYQPDLNRYAEFAHRKGATIVLFTDPWQSPIARLASQVLSIPTAAPSVLDTFIGHLMVAESLANSVATHMGPAVKPRIETLEDAFATLGGDPTPDM